MIKVAAFQGKPIEMDQQKAVDRIFQILEHADKEKIDILSFPESFLHGYLKNKELAFEHSIDLESTDFAEICYQFKNVKSTIILGLNELKNGKVYNSCVVIEHGKFLGVYRKAHTHPPYDYFEVGQKFPIFYRDDIPFGIIICLDSIYFEPARILALQGARIIFCPCFNRIPVISKLSFSMHQKAHFIARSGENNCWLIVSDVIWDEDGEFCPGYSSIFNSDGEMVAKAEPFHEGFLTYTIEKEKLFDIKEKRLQGTPALFEEMIRIYNLRFEKK